MPDPEEQGSGWSEETSSAPRWDPGATSVPRWDPESAGAAQPATEVPRWEPPRPGRARPARGAVPGRRARAIPGGPLVWWRRHPWAVVWISIFLTPLAVILLRFLDESGYFRMVTPLQWLLLAYFVGTLLFATLRTAARSSMRMLIGLGAALAGFGVLLWPMVWLTIGRTSCPSRAGKELGLTTAASVFENWKQGATDGAAWRAGTVDAAWADKRKDLALLEYNLVDSGCWDRFAPIAAGVTWHEFRVSVQRPDQTALSKIVIVHTAETREGWRITAVEGPLP